jgi:hypothetical protein
VPLSSEASLGIEVDLVARIRKGGVPAGEAGLVVELDVDVPAEDAIARTGTARYDGRESSEASILAAMDAVEVGEGELDALDAVTPVLLEEGHGEGSGSRVESLKVEG